jgi:hypothetical protein
MNLSLRFVFYKFKPYNCLPQIVSLVNAADCYTEALGSIPGKFSLFIFAQEG